jgi:hypothetical protein
MSVQNAKSRARIMFCAFCLVASSVWAEDIRSGTEGNLFWAEADLGFGRVERRVTASGSVSDDSVAGDFAGGLRVSPSWRIGLDLGGFNLQSTCLSSPTHPCNSQQLQRGKGIEHLLACADFRPSGADGWLLHAAVGGSAYWAQSVSQYYNRANSYGWGGELGTGYTWRFGMAGHAGLRAGYELGHLGGNLRAGVPAFDYSAFKLTLMLAYY